MNNQQLKDKYDQVYKEDSKKFYTYNSYPESRLILSMLERWNDLDVMEIGCGEGRLAATISFAGAKYIDAYDYSEEAIRIAKNTISLANIKYICQDYKENSAKYDVVVLQGVLEHLDNPFQELHYIIENKLNDNGCVITSSPSFLNPRGYVWMTLQMLFDIPMSLTDLHYLCPFDFEEFAKEYKYNVNYEATDHDWGSGARTIIDFKKRLVNALRDAGMDNSKVEKFLIWLNKAVVYYDEKPWSGATVAYKISK